MNVRITLVNKVVFPQEPASSFSVDTALNIDKVNFFCRLGMERLSELLGHLGQESQPS